MSTGHSPFEFIAKPKTWAFRIARFMYGSRRIIAGLAVIFILFYFLLNNPIFQGYLLKKTNAYLQEKLKTEVRVGKVKIELFSKLVLEDVFLRDEQGDTLIQAAKIKANLNFSPSALLSGQYEIDEVSLEDIYVHLQRKENQEHNNLQFVIDAFSEKKTEVKSKNNINLNINDLFLSNVRFKSEDAVKGQNIHAFVEDGLVYFNRFDLENKFMDVHSVVLREPFFQLDDLTAKPLSNTKKNKPKTTDTTSMKILVKNFDLQGGHFVFNNYHRSPEWNPDEEDINYNHLNINDIVLKVNNFSLVKEQYRGEVKHLSFADRKRFQLTSLRSKSVLVDSTTVQLYDCRLVTPMSDIGDTLIMNFKNYRDFKEYNDNVKMEGRFKNSKVALKDVEVFAPQLKRVEPFENQPNAIFSLNGLLKGKVNSLSGKNLTIGVLNKNLLLKGSFNSHNFAVRDEEVLNLKIESLVTDPLTIKKFFPKVNLPKGFERLKNMKIKGNFDGFFADFVADATLYSDLGTVVTDLRLDMRNGSKNAVYSGKLEFQNFDLGQYLNDSSLGKISSEVRISEGKNLSFKEGIANLKGKVSSINFKNYVYENVQIDGKLGKNKFDGILSIDNKDVALQFDGNIDFSNSIPSFHFKSTIDHFDLKKTNLSNKEQILSAYLDLDIDGDKLSNLNGTALAKNIKLIDQQSTQEFTLDSVHLYSKAGEGFLSVFELKSELFDARLDGKFRLDEIGAAFRGLLLKNYKGFAQRLNIKEVSPLENQNIGFQINVNQSKNWMNLFDIGLDSLQNIKLQGGYDTKSDQLTLNLDADKFIYKDVVFEDIAMKVKNDAEQGDALLILRKVGIGNLHLAPILTNYYFKGDTIDFAISSSSVTSVLDNLNLNGRFNLYDTDGYQIKFFPSDLTIIQEKWEMAEGNYVRFKKDFISVNDFKLTNEDRIATLHSIDGRGLELSLKNFDIHYLDEIWNYKELEFNGKYSFSFRAADIFEKKNLTAKGWMDSLIINNDNFGQTELTAEWKDFSQLVKANLIIGKDKTAKLKAVVQYQPKTNEAQSKKELRLPLDHYSGNIVLEEYPMKIAEYFISSGISHTSGTLDGNLQISGSIKDAPNVSGEATIKNTSTVINYLNVKYLIDNQKVLINNGLFDATGAILKDTLGNVASVYGGIYHDRLTNFRLGVNISSEKIIALNTTIKENPIYYGFGIGKIDATFSGPFDKTDIGIICNAQKGTKLFLPIKPSIDASTSNFIKFKQNTGQDNELFQTVTTTKTNKKSDKGMSLDMEVNVDPESEVQLIFDEKAGDIMRGRGNGALQLSIPRGRNLSMYGTYTIENGDYLFTLYNFINKPFKVKRGGVIQWNGDPFEAQIDIDAEYQGISTSPYNLISNYLDVSNIFESEARRSTSVELTLFLKGRLLKPDISFDIKMPELGPGNVKNLVDQQVNLLHQDPNELNRQVFGLIVTGTFLPSSIANFDPVSTVTNTGFNTVSEMVSNQLSNFISDVLKGVIKENSFISGIGFGFNYIYDTGAFRSIGNSTLPASSEVALRPTINLFDDKVIINYGFRRGVNENSVYYNHEASVLLSLSEDNRLKMRVYYKNDQDLILGNRNRAGLALSFREESNSFLKLNKTQEKK